MVPPGPYWVPVRVEEVSRPYRDIIEGEATLAGADLEGLPLHRWVNAILAWLRRSHLQTGSEEGRLAWDEMKRRLATPLAPWPSVWASAAPPPPGERPRRGTGRPPLMTPEQEAAAFAAFEGAQ